DGTGFEVTGLDANSLAGIRRSPPADWTTLFRVPVKPNSPADTPLTMLGEYSVTESSLRFIPRFSPSPGGAYRLTFAWGKVPLLVDIEIPKLDPTPRTVVSA